MLRRARLDVARERYAVRNGYRHIAFRRRRQDGIALAAERALELGAGEQVGDLGSPPADNMLSRSIAQASVAPIDGLLAGAAIPAGDL